MAGTGKVSLYPNIGIKKCGENLCGLYSAQYSLNRSIRSIYAAGKSAPVTKYGELPNIEVSYSQHLDASGNFDASEFNTISKLELAIRDSTVVCDMAFLSRLSYSFNIDGPFLVTKTYTGYSKTQSGSGSVNCDNGSLRIFSRTDYSGSIPPGISSDGLTNVTVDITVNREAVPEFATRKPYGVYVVFPITSSIKYEAYTKGSDSYVLDMMKNACGDPDIFTYSLDARACGKGIKIDKAFLTDINYSGADAASNSGPQTVSLTFTSYETFNGIKPIILFDDNLSSCAN